MVKNHLNKGPKDKGANQKEAPKPANQNPVDQENQNDDQKDGLEQGL